MPRSILLHIDSSAYSSARIPVARTLGDDFDAEVIAQPCMPRGFARRALYADLMILGQRDADDLATGDSPADCLSGVLVDSGQPAPVLPRAGEVASLGRTVLVAWKETREAARAVSSALPWLQRAWVPGGFTRTILQSMTLPVLMSH